MKQEQGLTFIEILLVVAIMLVLAGLILATVTSSRNKAVDNRIRSNISQMRILAEVAFDSSGGSFEEWAQEGGVAADVTRLRELIDEDAGDPAGAPYVTAVRESQSQAFCVSAPLRAETGSYYCIDATGQFQTTTSECPDYGDDLSGDPPLRCSGS